MNLVGNGMIAANLQTISTPNAAGKNAVKIPFLDNG